MFMATNNPVKKAAGGAAAKSGGKRLGRRSGGGPQGQFPGGVTFFEMQKRHGGMSVHCARSASRFISSNREIQECGVRTLEEANL